MKKIDNKDPQLALDGTVVIHQGRSKPKKPKDPKRVRAGKNSKRKGSSFERFIVNMFKDAGIQAKRGWWQSGEFARFRGKSKPTISDVLLEDGFEHLWLELGTGATMDDYKKLDQAENDIAGTKQNQGSMIPIAVTRRKGQRVVYATLKLADLVELIGLEEGMDNEAFGQLSNRDQRVSLRMPELVAILAKQVVAPAPSSPPAPPMFSVDPLDLEDALDE